LSNQRFRRVLARLLDKSGIATDVFGGYLAPATAPIAGADWTPSDLRWEGEDPEVPFVGTAGELDRLAARNAFRDAGYRYNDAGELLRR
jgi:peptide/nickel transport system substrate-binding protein